MKTIALTIVVFTALIAFGVSLASKQNGIVTSDEHNYRKTDPFHGSEAGATLLRACGNCHSNQTFYPGMAMLHRSHGGSAGISAQAGRN